MRDYVITVNSTVDLPKEWLEERHVPVIPLKYTIDGETYTDMEGLSAKEFFDKLREGKMSTTSQVNPEEAADMLEPFLKEGKDILHIAFSSGLSGSYNSARIAGEELMEKYPDRKIIVLDSLAASLGQGMIVYLAQQQKEEGKSIDEVAQWVKDHRLNVVHAFTVDDLNHLYRGGRVSKTTAVVGGVLNIKPVLHVDNEGKLIPVGKVRGRKKSLLALVDMMDQKLGSYKDSCDTIFVSHGDCIEDAQFVIDKIKEKYPIKTVLVNYVGATIGAHSGPGTVALFFLGDER